ncbi:phage head morphogenesis protein [Hymenobacter swuensis]|uniref:Phage head morphogenesis domain-containing protein n=1 Tax=Hymenobacter swuensis DY53 TaxID=1227739 RepID=W8F8M2_9BACT|nr:phage minor head protein [Hymenobacter swuensis]AHJ98946.1 hypothetical protein Hsw_3351 [Hymenobacter swuensis DY53]
MHQAQAAGGVQLGLFTATSNRLLRAVEVGYGRSDEKLLRYMRENISFFSAAKTQHQAVELSGLLLDEQGQRKPWRAFRNDALQVHELYNVRWLKTEYEHAVASAQMAAKWEEFEESPFLLQYETVGDSRVRPEHRAWDGITLPADHPWWQTHYPPNDWLCRCTAIGAAPDARPTPASILPALPEPDAGFSGNVGQTGVIFPLAHPYFLSLTASEQNALQTLANTTS